MAVRLIVANVAVGRIDHTKVVYGDVLGMEVAMDLGWIVTFAPMAA